MKEKGSQLQGTTRPAAPLKITKRAAKRGGALGRGLFLSALILAGTLPLLQAAQKKSHNQSQTQTQSQQESKQEQKPPATPSKGIVIPPEEAKVANPVKPTPESIAEGKSRYQFECASCHGVNGDGKGKLGVSMELNLPDFRDPEAMKSVTDGGLYYAIAKGHNPMLYEAARNNPTQVWDLVNYIRSLAQPKTPPKTTK
jgi:mono/diheme cytochrome c family protein